MKIIKLTLISLLSNSITLRRDKSIFCNRITISPAVGEILVISIFLLANYYIAFISDLYTDKGPPLPACITNDFQRQFYRITDGYLFSTLVPFSEQWCKEKKVELYKKGFPAVFEDMSQIKKYDYFAITNFTINPLSYYSLKNIPGIYMITNKITKKIYIGMSTNLKDRFYNYLDEKRLNRDRSSRINKALLKFGFDKFSISILEFTHIEQGTTVKISYLREDFFIKVFKPQYNIKRSSYNFNLEIKGNNKVIMKLDIPLKIKNLLDKCLDIIHELFSVAYKKYAYNLFNYLLNRLKEYKLFYLIVIFFYSIIQNIEKILLSNNGLSLLFIIGLFVGDQFIYYKTLLFLYYITFFKNYLQDNKEILKSYPKIKEFLINTFELLQKVLLGIILGIVTNTLVSYLKKIWGYILKMFRQNRNNTENNNSIQEDNGNNKNPNPDNSDPLLNKEEIRKKKNVERNRRYRAKKKMNQTPEEREADSKKNAEKNRIYREKKKMHETTQDKEKKTREYRERKRKQRDIIKQVIKDHEERLARERLARERDNGNNN